ncbi:hypothetical protein YYC_01907 [Plasmodium yoelii 17X]|uniref:Uncharacterized protein n=1 Tax=Plasmodium yoelii 17X TaxID=1323249 RepID=V7PRG8_PLAYE|nr:hypothetical protein YYC_01907 [Plasmodium yoelii 17X]
MEIFTGILIVLVLFFIYDYNFCSKALIFYIGDKSLNILKKCSSIERTYRSTVYLVYPFLQDIFIHVFYFYLEKKKEYLSYLISENSKIKKKINKNDEENEEMFVQIYIIIKKWIYFNILKLFFFIIEYLNIYENINLQGYINTREVLNNNNFGVVILDYYLPNATIKKKKKNNNNKKENQINLSNHNENYIIDLYDLINIKQEQKIKLILIDKKWKQILNIKNVESHDVHYLYIQDSVIIQYVQFLRIFKNKILNTSSNISPNYKDVEILSNILFSSTESENEITNKMVNYCLKKEEQQHGVQTENHHDKKNVQTHLNQKRAEKNDEKKAEKNDGKKAEKKEQNDEINNSKNPEKNTETKLRDKLYENLKKCEYKNIKGIIIIVPEMFYNYVNVKEMQNNIPIYYFLTKNVKIDTFTVIAKLLGYICVHVHININFGLSIPYLFNSKNINMLDILYNFNIDQNLFIRDYIFPDFNYLNKTEKYNKNNPKFMGNNPKFMGNNPNFMGNNPNMGNNPKFMGNNPNFMGNNPKFMGNNPKFVENNPKFVGNNNFFKKKKKKI